MQTTTHHQFKTLVEVVNHAHKTECITAPHCAVLQRLIASGSVSIVAAIVNKHMPYEKDGGLYFVPIQKRTRKG